MKIIKILSSSYLSSFIFTYIIIVVTALDKMDIKTAMVGGIFYALFLSFITYVFFNLIDDLLNFPKL
ncbi:MAG: hypothetical protein GXO31_09140 [Epsilonproteobacteria bacterium]|nr:hypothetical protein [Campylobacterota bacterium]